MTKSPSVDEISTLLLEEKDKGLEDITIERLGTPIRIVSNDQQLNHTARLLFNQVMQQSSEKGIYVNAQVNDINKEKVARLLEMLGLTNSDGFFESYAGEVTAHYANGHTIIRLSNYHNPSLSTWRRDLSYITDHLTTDYCLVHGCGFSIANEEGESGIVLTGANSSGKSTIYQRLEEATNKTSGKTRLVDADLVFVSGDGRVYSPADAKVNQRECWGEEGSLDVWTEEFIIDPAEVRSTDAVPLNAMVYLDRSVKAGECKRLSGPLDRGMLLDPTVSEPIAKKYLQKQPVEIGAPFFVVGTRGPVELTYNTVVSLLKESGIKIH